MNALQVLLFALLFWLVGIPLITLIHELSHAAAALLLTNNPVRVGLGSGPPQIEQRVGRLTLQIRLFSGAFGFCFWRVDHALVGRRVWILLGGPLASLLMVVAFSLAAYFLRDGNVFLQAVCSWTAFGALLQLIFTALPIRYPAFWGAYVGMASDGLRIRQLLQNP